MCTTRLTRRSRCARVTNGGSGDSEELDTLRKAFQTLTGGEGKVKHTLKHHRYTIMGGRPRKMYWQFHMVFLRDCLHCES